MSGARDSTDPSFLNSSAPFTLNEHNVQWKRPPYPPWGFDYYPDWNFTNSKLTMCAAC